MEGTKEKAEELIDKFMDIEDDLMEQVMYSNVATQCAIICVEEIMQSGCTRPSNGAYYGDNEEAVKFWQEVLTHLKK